MTHPTPSEKPRCRACGAVLALNDESLCRPCMQKKYSDMHIAPEWIELCENASKYSIQLVADVLTGRKKVGDDW